MKFTGRLIGLIIVAFLWFLIYIYASKTYPSFVISLAIFCGTIAIGWFLGKKYDFSKYYSEKDPLTEVYNRRIGLELAEYLKKLVERNQEGLAVLMIDIDNFKQINDSYGHSLGDQVLQTTANILQDCIRKSDLVIRYGGDEFVMVFIQKNTSDLKLIKNRILERIAQIQKDISVPVSISIGSAVYPEDSTEIDTLISLADRGMYKNKGQRKELSSLN